MAFKMKKNGGLYMKYGSPNKNYQNPEEYKAFNMGNEADKLSKEERSSFKMKGFSGFGNSPSPAKLKEVLIENEDGVMVSVGTGPEAREKAAKVARENQRKEDEAIEAADFKTEEEMDEFYANLKPERRIEFTDEDKDINEQALLDLQEMDRGGVGSRLYNPQSTDTQRRYAVGGDSQLAESDISKKKRKMNQK